MALSPCNRLDQRLETVGNGLTKAVCHSRYPRGNAGTKKEIRIDRVLEDCHSYHPQPHCGYDHLSYSALAVPTTDLYILHPPAQRTVNRSVQNVTIFTAFHRHHHVLPSSAASRNRTSWAVSQPSFKPYGTPSDSRRKASRTSSETSSNPSPVYQVTGRQSDLGA